MSGPVNNAVEEIALIVHYQALPGKGDQVAGLLARHTAATRAEPGCRDFVAPLLADRRLEYRQVIEPSVS
jgi:quinol monooxygenase YgiN